MAWDPATVLLGGLAVLLVVTVLGVVFATRAQRRGERAAEERRTTPESGQDVVRWIEEGRQLFVLSQNRIERWEELQSELVARADEVERLAADVARMDELRADLTRLGQETAQLRTERDAVQAMIARINQDNDRLRSERDELLAAFRRMADLVEQVRRSRGGGS